MESFRNKMHQLRPTMKDKIYLGERTAGIDGKKYSIMLS
jgi:hypothetical protein